ncbi:helix-turn-helix domain-containing protein [Ligilactobacillus salivarius]|uniref:helix-turn-helix domain-containing protein n=1 Tax=Ligilactobacillus salivarius TaxID=1624 RepID=UPI000C14BAC8|nr:helix-turn-helix transcriptional regulator [Ligilactobacillus salivarius]MBC6925538.1 XRE family transcriptional regulator [Ligilactobacillus salivarius]PHY96877.1 transcriptional regulator [Ligilactobacillus salivarius]
MLGNNIKELRKSKRMTQRDLAEAMKVSQQTVGAWETERAIPGADTLSELADYFNVTTDYLLGRPEKKDDDTKTADIDDDDVIFTYEGRRIPKEDLELIRRIMRGTRNDIK